MLCKVCGNPSKLMCQRCNEHYCNDVCQRKDWQEHKYICTAMPRLVKVNTPSPSASKRRESGTGNAIKNQPRPLKENIPIVGNNHMDKELSNTWRESFIPREKMLFKGNVTYIDKDETIWLFNGEISKILERFTADIAECFQTLTRCDPRKLSVGDLVGVSVKDQMYRGEVKSLNIDHNKAAVRLIDHGPIVQCDTKHIYMPMQLMSEIRAYAFQAKLPSNKGIQINQNQTFCLMGTKTPQGIPQAQIADRANIPLNLLVEYFTANSGVTIVKIFPNDVMLKKPQVALLKINEIIRFNEELTLKLTEDMSGKYQYVNSFSFPNNASTFFLAARTEQGYTRALLLDVIKNSMQFLVYAVDEGRIFVANDVRRLPSEFKVLPLGVFAVSLESDKNLHSLEQVLTQYGSELRIKCEMDDSQDMENTVVHSAKASLLGKDGNVCAVRISTFLGRICELGLKYWKLPIENNSLVYISYVINYSEIYISSIQTKQYDKIFKDIQSRCQLEVKNISVASLVLVVNPDAGNYRAEVTAVEKNKVTVLNIDTGTTCHVLSNQLRMPCRFLENLPVSLQRVKIKTICDFPPTAIPPNAVALKTLKNLAETKAELQVVFDQSNSQSVDLLDPSEEPPSLMTRILPMMFMPSVEESEPVKSVVEADQSLPPSPPSPPNQEAKAPKQMERYYFKDLEHRSIPLGNDIKILLLNSEGVHKTGYVTACYLRDEHKAEELQNFIHLVRDIGASDKLKPGYLPEIGELCLAYYEMDSHWYRAVCQQVSDQKVSVLYCDFGNEEVVPVEKVKPISADLVYEVNATKCFIDGFDKDKNFMKLEDYLGGENMIVCTVIKEGPEPNSCIIQLPFMNKMLSME